LYKVLVLNQAPCHEDILGSGGDIASHPGCLTPRERAPGTHWTGGCVGPRHSLDSVKEKNSQPPLGIKT